MVKERLFVLKTDASSVYDGNEPTVAQDAYTVSGQYVTGDALNDVLSKVEGVNVGTYAINATCENDNYTIAVENGTYTISKANITISTMPQNSEYNGTEKEINQILYELSGAYVDGDEFNITLSKELGVNAGNYTLYVNASNDNYNITLVNSTYTIDQVNITVRALPQSSIYNGQEQVINQTAFTTSEGFVSGDNLNVLITKVEGIYPGTYDLVITASNLNYITWCVNNTFEINKATLTIMANNQSSTFDYSEPTLNQTIFDVVGEYYN